MSIENFDEILEIQADSVLVEPRVTFDKLVKETLKQGLVPPVVPEFKGITVGGAFVGASLESSSLVYGQVSDTVLAVTVLLGNGELIEASSDKNSDLFWALSGSLGTLGLIVSLRLKLIPAKKNVHVGQKGSFEETIVYNDCRICLPAVMTDETANFWTTPFSDWYYRRVKKRQEFIMPLYDYLFRYDHGAFWMASTFQGFSWILYHLYKGTKIPAFGQPQEPPALLRPLFSSQRLYKSLHAMPKGWFENNFIVQDFYIPASNVDAFIAATPLSPLWLCPVKPAKTPQLFSPHSLPVDKLVDVGVYGLHKQAKAKTQELEVLCTALGGRKMLYSYNYFTEAEFWQIYPREVYETLRRKYFAAEAFPSICEKVLPSRELSHES